MMKKIKIVYVVYSFEVGGIESLLLQLCNKLDKKKYKIFLLTLTNDQMKLIPSLNEDVIVYSLSFNRQQIKSFKGITYGFKELLMLINLIKPDIIHTHFGVMPLLFISLAMKLSKMKILHFRTIHTAGLFYENQITISNKIKLMVERLAMKLYKTYLISVSKIVHKNNDLYFKNIVQGIKLIPNGVDLKKYNKEHYKDISKKNFNFSDDSLLITYVSRLDYGKNHDFLIDLWGSIVSQVPNAILCLAGDGILKDYLINKAMKNNLQDSVKFMGSITNIPELLSVTDIAVFPSSYEGFSLVMLEELAMKLPIVASDIASFKEILVDKENGFLLSLDSPDDFIKCIVLLCNEPSLRKNMGEKGYVVAQKFSIENTIKLHDEYYMSVCKK